MSKVCKNKQPLIVAALSLIALAVSAYLFYEHILVNYSYTEGLSVCSISEKINCAAAAKSSFSKFFGIPISLWGLGLYTLMIIWSLKIYLNPKKYQFLSVISYTLFLGSVFYSVALGLISWLVIKAFCPFCVSLYFINICIFLVLMSMTKGNISVKKIVNSIFFQFNKKSTLTYLVVFIAIILAGLKYKNWWAFNHSNSVIFYNSHHSERIDLKKTNYLRFGNKEAKNRIDIFSDYQCRHCEKAHVKISQFLKEHPKQAVVYMHNFPLDETCNPLRKGRNLHKDACQASRLSIALQKRGIILSNENHDIYKMSLNNKDKNFTDKIKNLLKEKRLPLNLLEEMNSSAVKAQLKREVEEGIALGVKTTPSIFINGYPVPKIPDSDFLLKMLSLEAK